MVRETRFARAASWMGTRRSRLTELLPVAARHPARLGTRGVFGVVPATKDASRRPRAPRWHATLAGDNRFPRTPALPGPPTFRDTGESGTLVRQEGDAPSSSTWQADALLLSYCLVKLWGLPRPEAS